MILMIIMSAVLIAYQYSSAFSGFVSMANRFYSVTYSKKDINKKFRIKKIGLSCVYRAIIFIVNDDARRE